MYGAMYGAVFWRKRPYMYKLTETLKQANVWYNVYMYLYMYIYVYLYVIISFKSITEGS